MTEWFAQRPCDRIDRVRSYGAWVERDRTGPSDARSKAVGRAVVHEHAGDAVDDGLERTAAGKGDDGTSARLRFDRHDAEVFLAGKEDGRRATVEVTNVLVGSRAEQRDVAGFACMSSQCLAFGTVADDSERDAREVAGVNRHVEALVGTRADTISKKFSGATESSGV